MNELDDSSSNDVFGIHDALVTVVISFVRRFVLEFVDLRVVYVYEYDLGLDSVVT